MSPYAWSRCAHVACVLRSRCTAEEGSLDHPCCGRHECEEAL